MKMQYQFSESLVRFIKLANLDIDDPDTYERDGSRSFVNHVLLYGRHRDALENILDALSGNVNKNKTYNSTDREIARVDVRRKRSGTSGGGGGGGGGLIEIVFQRQGRSLVIDVGWNRKSMCGIPAFLSQIVSATEITSSRRRMIVMKNTHLLTPSTQYALRAVVEKAAATTWLVFTSANLSSLDASLLSRFVCLNATPAENVKTQDEDDNQQQQSNQENHDAFAARLFAKIARLKSTSQLKSVVAAIPKTELPRRMISSPSTCGSSASAKDYDVLLGPLFLRIVRQIATCHLRDAWPHLEEASARISNNGTKSGTTAHIHPEDLYALVTRFAELERQHAESKMLLLNAGDTSVEEEEDTVPTVHLNNYTHALIACACMETHARLCFDQRCCANFTER